MMMPKVLRRFNKPSTALEEKNLFVVELLEQYVDTSQPHTYRLFGDGDTKSVEKNGAFFLVTRDPTEPRDYTGFAIAKDFWQRRSSATLKESIEDFVRTRYPDNIVFDRPHLTVRFGNEEYWLSAYADGGYADEATVYVTKSFNFSAIKESAELEILDN